MRRIEYRHVRWKFSLAAAFSRTAYDRELMETLQEHGNNGWDLKGTIYELGFHVHLIFSRPVESDAPLSWTPSHCPNCGYSLMGNSSGVCPECGQTVRAAVRSPGQE